MIIVLRYVLFALQIYLMIKLFRKIAVEYIFDPQLYRTDSTEHAPVQEFTSVYQKKAS